MRMYQFHCLLRRFYSSIPIVGGICILISFLLIVSVYPLFCAAQEPLKKLHADGQYIKNSDGVIVNLKGFNIEFHQWAYKEATYDPIARTWRYNRAESELDADFQAMAQWNLTLNDFKGDLAE